MMSALGGGGSGGVVGEDPPPPHPTSQAMIARVVNERQFLLSLIMGIVRLEIRFVMSFWILENPYRGAGRGTPSVDSPLPQAKAFFRGRNKL
jgi:hypothetical protein